MNHRDPFHRYAHHDRRRAIVELAKWALVLACVLLAAWVEAQ